MTNCNLSFRLGKDNAPSVTSRARAAHKRRNKPRGSSALGVFSGSACGLSSRQHGHCVPVVSFDNSLDALANAALPLDISGAADTRSQAKSLLERVGLSHRTNHYPRQLSGGEQQRGAIARALVHKPRLILADEPTGNLDEKTGNRIADLLFELHTEMQSTLVIVTHDMRLAKRYKRLFWLESGKLRVEDSSELSA